MIPVMCIVQEGQLPTAAADGLKSRISDFTQRVFSAPADIDWIVVPKGSGFTAAGPSASVIASLPANRPLCQSERRQLLKELVAICMAQTGQSAHEIVASIRNPTG